MKQYQKLVALVLTLLMVIGLFPTTAFAVGNADAAAGDLRCAYTPQEHAASADPEEWVTVIVELDGATTLDKDDFVRAFRRSSKGFSTSSAVAAYRTKLVDQHETVAKQISAINAEAGFRYHYTNLLNGFAAAVQRKDIDAIKALDGVLNVYVCKTYQYDKDWQEGEVLEAEELAQILRSDSGSIGQLDLQEAWDAGYTGAGKVVAIFDSSLLYTHKLFNYMDPAITAAKPDNYKTKESLQECISANADTLNLFRSDWGSWFHGREETGFDAETQAAIRNGDFWRSEKVPFAVDYFDGDLEVWDGDTSSHGTHVAGIAAGNGGPDFISDVKGAAYDAQIMFFKVFSEYDAFAQESDEAVIAALDDAITLGVNAINLSLGIDFGFATMQSYAQGGYQKAYNRAQAAGISVAVSAGNSQRTQRNLSTLVNGATTVLPNKYSVGFSGSFFGPMTVASAQGAGYVQSGYSTTAAFASESLASARTSSDSGPSGFTSWGVTEALRLTPDIMTPGGSILSAGASSDTALVTMSGTSMASPNMCGSFIPVQQYVDANLDVFGVQKGTQEYSNIINQLVASNTKVYLRTDGRSYHSPRRQGAGMPQIGDITRSRVVLHNNVAYDPVTGEAPRTKVDLMDKLGDTFDITFTLENYNDAPRTFDVKANVQTDGTSTNSGRTIIHQGTESGYPGADNGAISFTDAVITVKSLSGGAKVDAASANVNQFAEGFRPATITVPARSSTVVTLSVALNAETMAVQDALWPNGMFLEGFVFFNSESDENVSIPYMGFRGDWNQAPIFDFDSLYSDYSGKAVADLDYPLFAISGLTAKLPDGSQALLGASQYSGFALPDYYNDSRDANRQYSYQAIRNYTAKLKDSGMFSADFSSFSPNADGFMDTLNANLGLLRHAKALAVEIVDAEGKVVATLGPDYDYFLAFQGDGMLVQQIAQTEGGPYSHTMGWDGKGADGSVVADGTYIYRVCAITEYQYLKALEGQTDNPRAEDVLAAVKGEGSQSFEMPFSVDTKAPVVTANAVSSRNVWNVTLTDAVGIQAVAVYYDGTLLGDIVPVNAASYSGSFDLNALLSDKSLIEGGSAQDIDPARLQLQAIDFAFNRTVVEAVVNKSGCPGDESCPSAVLTDVNRSPKSWYHAAVDWAFVTGVTKGKTETTFAPHASCTRAEAVTFLWRAMGKPAAESTECAFTDVSAKAFYYKALLWAVETGVTNGVSATAFDPNGTCTRGQIVTFLWRAEGKPTADTPAIFDDVPSGKFFTKAVAWAVESGITNGTGNNRFKPNGTCTRAEIVTFLWRDASGQ